jgi:hypothetical protein
MRRSNLVAVFVLLFALSGAKAQAQTGGLVQLKDGRISFALPAGFKPMSKEHIAFKFGRLGAEKAPKFAYSNERQTVSVAVDFLGRGLQAMPLEDVKKAFEAGLERSVPGLEWIEREIVERDGRRWIHLRLKFAAVDTDIFNNIYATVFDGQLLTFNFNSTVAQYEKYKDSLLKSAQTITVK